ncbi:aminotransferase class V-fold PLP-dependent enzyme [bacterium]|nr:aminotransferase class V-fold PLP-dependent enzyme [bacterium]
MEKFIYFDNAATTWPKPESVYRFMDEFYRNTGVNPGRSGFDMAIEAGNLIESLRKRLTRFFGGDEDAPERLSFGYNATDAMNTVLQGLIGSGDHIISTNLEHNAVIRPINHLVRDHGAEATFIPFNQQGFIEPDTIRSAIKPTTKVVVVNHCSNVIGTIQPIAQIGKICKEHGVTFVLDSSQTAGVIPINMKEMNVDVLVFTGHKALMGSTGIGGLYVRKHVDIKSTRSGGTGVNSIDPFQPEQYPWKLEIGTPNLVGMAALWAGQDWIESKGLQCIFQHEKNLVQRMINGFKKIKGVTVYCADSLENHLSTVLINVEGIDASNVGIKLDIDHDIAVRTGLHCAPLVHKQLGTVKLHGGIRFSIGAFNTEEEVDTAINAIAEIAADQQIKPGARA